MIGIRDAVRNLIEAQRDGCDDEQLHALQADLTQNYDTFVKEFGNIHKRGNKLAFERMLGIRCCLHWKNWTMSRM